MANESTLSGQLRPMRELSNYTIERGDPDPRGYAVVGTDGYRIGTVADLLVDTTAMKVRQLLVEFDGTDAADDALITLNVDDVEIRTGTREVFAPGYAGATFERSEAQRYTGAYPHGTASTDRDESRLTRTEEELRVGKREVSRGEVRVGKHVETEHVSEPVTRRREEVVIERRPVSGEVSADRATIGDAEVRIPLMEEEVIVDKRPVVKEELVVGKRVVEERDVVEAEVRKEQFDIDNPSEAPPAGRERYREDR